MKAKKLLVLPFVLLSLFSCGNDVKLPNKGTEIQKATGIKALNEATTVSTSNDAFGFRMTSSKTGISMDLSSVSNYSGTNSSVNSSYDFSMTDLDTKFAISGLTSSNIEDLKASLTFGVNLNGDISSLLNSFIAAGTSSSKLVINEGKYSFDSYLRNGVVYANLSQKNMANLLNTLYPNQENNTKLKLDITSLIPEGTLPLLSTDNITSIQEDISSFTKQLIDNSPEGVFKDHGNDIYSFSDSLIGDEIKSEIKTSLSSIESLPSFDIDVTNKSEANLTVIFSTKTGLTGFAFNFNIDATLINTISSESTSSISTTINLKAEADFSVNFSYGEDVKVEELKDPSNYVETDIIA